MLKNSCKYPVEFAEDVFGENDSLAKLLSAGEDGAKPRVLIVADMNVVQRTEGLGSKIGRYFTEAGIELAAPPVVIAAGEKIKADKLQSALKVMSAVLDAKLAKRDVVLVIGGGSLFDVAGYAAAQVRGGTRVVRIPTTPASMMDAAFATYAAVDSVSVKDALRVPCAPAAVFIDPTFARTVLDGVWNGGFGEAVRGALVSDSALVKKLVSMADAYRVRNFDALDEMIRLAVASRRKKGISDFAEWSAMRLEAMSGYRLPHGYAVSAGVSIDTAYAVAAGTMRAEDRELAIDTLVRSGAGDGIAHSRHLLYQHESLLHGLDAWRLTSGTDEIVYPAALGKSVSAVPDRGTYEEVLTEIVK